jgi:hypothetical protein
MKRKTKTFGAWFGRVKKGDILVETETRKQLVVVGGGRSTAHLRVKDMDKYVYEFHNCFLEPYCRGEA